MKSLWNEQDRAELAERLGRLTPDARPLWGRMSCPQMVAHLADALRMTLGDLPVRPRKLPLRWPILKQLVVYLIPVPKSAPTAPELISRRPDDWAAEQAAVAALLRRFADVPPGTALPDHPAFGKLSRRDVGVLTYRHLDHHLRQFGV